MHDCPGWSKWLAGIVIFTVAILWSRPRPKKKYWYFVEMTYADRNGTWRLKGNFTIGMDRNGRTVSLRTLKKMVAPIHTWKSWPKLNNRYTNGNLVVSQFSYLGYFADYQ